LWTHNFGIRTLLFSVPMWPLLSQILGAFAKLRRGTISCVMSVRLSRWNNSAPTELFFSWNLIFEHFFKDLLRKSNFIKIWQVRITATLHEDLSTFLIISCSVLLRMEKVWGKACRENQNAHITRTCNFFLFENRTFYKIICKITKELGIIWRMRITCWTPKATHEQSQYVILIVFHCNNCCTKAPQCYMYIACLVGYTHKFMHLFRLIHVLLK
jgi:hypothetical protein